MPLELAANKQILQYLRLWEHDVLPVLDMNINKLLLKLHLSLYDIICQKWKISLAVASDKEVLQCCIMIRANGLTEIVEWENWIHKVVV